LSCDALPRDCVEILKLLSPAASDAREFNLCNQAAAFRFPYFKYIIATRRDDPAPIRAEGTSRHAKGMAGQGAQPGFLFTDLIVCSQVSHSCHPKTDELIIHEGTYTCLFSTFPGFRNGFPVCVDAEWS
jgi:hypothetical protein